MNAGHEFLLFSGLVEGWSIGQDMMMTTLPLSFPGLSAGKRKGTRETQDMTQNKRFPGENSLEEKREFSGKLAIYERRNLGQLPEETMKKPHEREKWRLLSVVSSQ